jgi:hypothetical protein
MSTMVKRTAQAMAKMAADQVGNQEASEQIGGKMGMLVNSTTDVQQRQSRAKTEDFGRYTYSTGISQDVQTATFTNLGFTETPPHL